jgi:sortase (surface protein transpeptidase)
VNQAGGRRGDRLWPAVFVVSALLAVGAIWRLDPEVAPRAVAESMVTVATAASPAASATTQERIAAGRSAKVRDDPATPWPTHAANPEQVDSDRRGLPQLLIIPRIELEMPIVATKVDKAGLMDLPDRPTRIGWYSYGPRPGGHIGSAVLGGHVDSRKYGIGPLADLDRLSRGDQIIVRTASGSSHFEVESVRRISKQALPVSEIFARNGSPKLRIVSCGGAYIPSRGGYTDNVVVTATPQ